MNKKLRAHLNFWGGAVAAALAGWVATDDNASLKAVICAVAIPFVTSIVQQTRSNPLEDDIRRFTLRDTEATP